jgi:DNA invertase Pin-like site-specific DNA recombinase
MADKGTPQLRAGVYGRESKGKAKSVDDQVSIGLRVIDDRGWQHVGSYDDGSSASRFATKVRADWQRLFADIAEGKLDVLIVWEITRGSREPVEGFTWLNLCRDHGVLIYVISDEELYDPRKTRAYDTLGRALLDGAKESNTTSDRVLRGVAAAATNGTPHGAVPYGYLRRYDPVTKAFAEQRADPETAPIVREIFSRVARNDPIVAIVNDLNARGIPSPKGVKWHRYGIRSMVRNVAYAGRRSHQGIEYTAVWKPLVDDATFRAANAVLDTPGRRVSKPGQKRWLLTYLATAPCGGPLHGQPERTGQDRARKPAYACLGDGCVSIGQWELDEYVSRLVVARLSRDDARDLFLADDEAVAVAKEEAAALRSKLDEARDSYARSDGISVTSLAFTEKKLTPLIQQAERRILAATVPAAVVDLVTADDVRKVWEGLPLGGRRSVVDVLLERIVVGKPVTRLSRWSTDDDRLAAADERVDVGWRES